jgi:hypothetical protein
VEPVDSFQNLRHLVLKLAHEKPLPAMRHHMAPRSWNVSPEYPELFPCPWGILGESSPGGALAAKFELED